MIDLIRTASTLQFILGAVAFATGLMIVLQAAVRRGVWTPYILAFMGAIIGLAVTLR